MATKECIQITYARELPGPKVSLRYFLLLERTTVWSAVGAFNYIRQAAEQGTSQILETVSSRKRPGTNKMHAKIFTFVARQTYLWTLKYLI